MSGSTMLIQRKLIRIDSNLSRYCLIKKIPSSKCTFRWREFIRCHSIINCFSLRWYSSSGRVQMAAALLQLGHLCLEVLITGVQQINPWEIMSFPTPEKASKSPHVQSSVTSICLHFPQMLILHFTEVWK